MARALDIQINGIVPIIPTPFTADDQADWTSHRNLIDFACAADACAVCLPAYASEFYKLSEDERQRAVTEAVGQMRGRIPVIAQVNYPSAAQAVREARAAQKSGASAIAVAVPRMFNLPESDLHRYFDKILSAIDIPLLIQDFSPSGPTVSPGFVASLNRAHPHFRWLKLEEPMMATKVVAVLQATSGAVGVLEGWGGMYILDLIPAGICGVMPSLSLVDLLARIFRLAKAGDMHAADEIYQVVLPQIVFSLQHMELYHHAEKRLLEARGVLARVDVRDLRLELDRFQTGRIAFLNGQILALLDRLKMPRNPVPAAAISGSK